MGKQGSCKVKGRVKIEIGEEVNYLPGTIESFQLFHGNCKKVSLPLGLDSRPKDMLKHKDMLMCVSVNIALPSVEMLFRCLGFI